MSRSTNRRSRRTALGVASLLSVVSLAACGSDGDSDAGSDTEIIVGAYGPLTGPAASLSVLYDAQKAYYEELNANGGIDGLKVKLVVKDDQLNPANTPAAARQLVESDKAALLCGSAGSPTTMAVKSYLEQRKVGIVPGAGSSELAGETSFLLVPDYLQLGAQLAEYAAEEAGATKVAIAYTDDSVGQPTLAGAKWQMEQLGLELVAEVAFNGTAPDQSATVAKLKDSGADFVIINNTAPVISQVFKAAEKIGFAPTWGATWPSQTKALLELAGSSLETGNIVFSTPFVLGTSEAAADFRRVLDERAPDVDQTDTIAMLGWSVADACTEVLKRAVEANDGEVPSSEEVVESMPGTTLDDGVVNGLAWTEEDHSGQKKAMIVGLEDGEFVELTEFDDLPDVPVSASE
ncbi:ABC transporter substrate-binding protein [Nocardioides pantholopis]|uniref:ABC transporter substrate-binding protein n=1 Tax=Nocardioides pantholopis TaxID=2483798 RepID=UPI000FD90DCA|nr:ABC transporter substrate-binding protein [Nocardioides pantholopis]